jgi:ATP-dependent exoDNAse (exonuclease V) beta subunit
MSTPGAATATAANDYLAKQNPHPRDAHIHFDEGPHKYTIDGINGITADTEFTSVTTFIHQHFEHFDAKKVIAAMMRNQKKWNDPIANAKYYGKTAEEIEQMWADAGKDASTKGTAMHHQIECFYNTPPALADPHQAITAADVPPEFEYFLNFNKEHVAGDDATLRPYRTEWTVFHEEAQIAGSIDMVYSHISDDGSLSIYDWKRCREIIKTNRAGKFATHPAIEHLPDTNFWHYALQLNTYKYILQTKYDKTITDLYLIVLHPDAQNYQRVKLPDLQTEVAELFEERIRRNTTRNGIP